MQLSPERSKVLAQITGNIAVAWFSIGFISPIFIKSQVSDIIVSITIGFGMTIIFSLISILLIQERR